MNALSFIVLFVCMGWSSALQTDCTCPEVCPQVVCTHPELKVKDECNCCDVCLGIEGDVCGGQPNLKQCALSDHKHGFSCVMGDQVGECLCKHPGNGPFCGNDGQTYNTRCDLHIASWIRKKRFSLKLKVAYIGECKKAPVLTRIPQNIVNRSGDKVYIACEAYGIPTPSIQFRKVSLEHLDLFKEMPSDRLNTAVQIRGGPGKNKISAWLLIDPITQDDDGWYECLASNNQGSVSDRSRLEVVL